MRDFLFWADGSQTHYELVSLTLIFAIAALGVWSVQSPRLGAFLSTRNGTLGYLVLVLLALLGARWPTFFVYDPLNQDEAQMLAQAITALQHPIPWLDFDGTTSGPFNTYVLDLPALLAQPLSFFSTRVIGMLLEFGAIASLYVATLLRFDAALARIAVLPPLFLFSFLTQDEMVHYSSERLSIFLGSLALALLCLALRFGLQGRWVFAIGAALGTMPLAKLQSAPLAAGIGAAALAVALAAPRLGVRAKGARALALIAGSILVPAVTLGIVAAAGALRDFWISYIQMAFAYILFSYEPFTFLTTTKEAGPLIDVLLATTLLGGLALAAGWKRVPPALRNAFAASLVVLAAAIYTVFSPRHGTVHYVLFAVLPGAFAAAAGLALLETVFVRGKASALRRTLLAGAFVSLEPPGHLGFYAPLVPLRRCRLKLLLRTARSARRASEALPASRGSFGDLGLAREILRRHVYLAGHARFDRAISREPGFQSLSRLFSGPLRCRSQKKSPARFSRCGR